MAQYERVRPDVLQSRLLDDVADKLIELANLVSMTIPQGIVEGMTLTLSGNNVQQIRPLSPWFYFTLYNKDDSDGTVYVRVNDANGDERPVKPDDSFNVNFGAAIIHAIYVRTDADSTATIEVSAGR